jgi:hypothetical protein
MKNEKKSLKTGPSMDEETEGKLQTVLSDPQCIMQPREIEKFSTITKRGWVRTERPDVLGLDGIVRWSKLIDVVKIRRIW